MVSYNEFPLITSIDQVRKGSVISSDTGIYIYLLVSVPRTQERTTMLHPMFSADLCYIKAPKNPTFKGIHYGIFHARNNFRLISY